MKYFEILVDAGFCDAVNRLNNIYIFMKKFFIEYEFVITEKSYYINWHAKEYDFYDKFGINIFFKKNIIINNSKIFSMKFISDNINNIDELSKEFNNYDHIIIDCKQFWPPIKIFPYYHQIFPDLSLYNKIKYKLNNNKFEDNKIKVLFHLRRDDLLCEKYLKFIKPINEYIKQLKNLKININDCDIIMCSDGLNRKYDISNNLIKNLYDSTIEDYKFTCKKFIGTDNYNTDIFFDSLCLADIIIYNYSNIPIIFQELKLIKGSTYKL
jgi:hypothetical protein